VPVGFRPKRDLILAFPRAAFLMAL
jgi:hypothetical protein